MSRSVSIFVGFTPYHACSSAPIIDQVEGDVYCYFSKVWPKTNKIQKYLGGSNLVGTVLHDFLALLHLSILIRLLAWRGKKVDFYIPHPGHIFTNYVFRARVPSRRVFLYEDGLLNYVDVSAGNKFVNPLKRLVALLLALPYSSYSGHLAGYDEGLYDGAFLSMPAEAVRKDRLGKIREIEFYKSKVAVIEKTILFLDQDVSGYLTEDWRKKISDRLFSLYPIDEYKYYYKAHHDYFSDLGLLMNPVSPDFSALPAEDLIEELRPSHVIGFFSSALVNVKNRWPEVQCISLAGNEISVKRDGSLVLLGSLFEKVGIDCV